ncbi:mitochondrial tRNA-specific 2-thiouridylase 1 [Galendromus occidentalis]|uniref:tRNA-5-taurinomethyluridine 2-sulfurtransferase n=1 Tax=Galendromus occidentalis TaxID=34638 RepID=A0AAJ7L3Q9_9ACAR|nr:mitochondrial tRNA-specific 2-thiouridylase 1 [Galendromus occidentalis]
MIACALSGGVDSAVSLHLLLKRFPRRLVKAVFMRNWNEGGDIQCPLSEDLSSAQAVAEHFDVEITTVDLSKAYWLNVFEPMLQEYTSGLTPNPDVLCNRHIKFGRLLDFCQNALGAEKLATGHYARTRTCEYDKTTHLLRGKDLVKDQTFFLAGIHRSALQFAEFPIGEFSKPQVKRMAVDMGLPELAARKESMGICFIGKRDFKGFIDQYAEARPGNFIDMDTGRVVGEHKGKHMWTLGQRALLRNSPARYFISRTSEGNDIFVCAGHDHPSLFADSVRTFTPHWINPSFEGWTGNLTFKSQNKEPVASCKIVENTEKGLSMRLGHFKRAVAPGQYIALYDGEECVGSAKVRWSGASIDLSAHDHSDMGRTLSGRRSERDMLRALV